MSHISDNLAGVNEKLQKEGPIYELVAKISMTNVLDDEVDARLSWTTPVSNLDLADPTTSEPGAAEARIWMGRFSSDRTIYEPTAWYTLLSQCSIPTGQGSSESDLEGYSRSITIR